MTLPPREPGGWRGARAYNPCMLHTFQQLVGTALMERLVLALNHVLGAELAAVRRLQVHAGRSIRLHLTGWPSLLPPLPELTFLITPAGLLEWCSAGLGRDADLSVTLDASNPARLMAQGLAGKRPPVDIAGDSQLATDVSWLIDNLRWDIEDDLARVVGPVAARELSRVGRVLAAGLRDAVASLSALAARARGEPRPEQPAR